MTRQRQLRVRRAVERVSDALERTDETLTPRAEPRSAPATS
ncbi:hypothetical protein [Natronococcus sp. JC468]|nr:hypothetical protein [Natronococcus sp. JC468]